MATWNADVATEAQEMLVRFRIWYIRLAINTARQKTCIHTERAIVSVLLLR